ncbi:hypothetical protein GGR56DRAFT_656319 [Xylariaceae sp. FL0804]|nr:hypothetical protein GGR56DRAFT_656319 [Xylariaceae sp. FL0804]
MSAADSPSSSSDGVEECSSGTSYPHTPEARSSEASARRLALMAWFRERPSTEGQHPTKQYGEAYNKGDDLRRKLIFASSTTHLINPWLLTGSWHGKQSSRDSSPERFQDSPPERFRDSSWDRSWDSSRDSSRDARRTCRGSVVVWHYVRNEWHIDEVMELQHRLNPPCELSWLGDCSWDGDSDSWIEHTLTHLRDHPPRHCLCWFCDEEFDARSQHENDIMDNFRRRMLHILTHWRHYPQNIQLDPLFLDHVHCHGLIDDETYCEAQYTALAGTYANSFIPKQLGKSVKHSEKTEPLLIDQDKEDRQIRRLRRSPGLIDLGKYRRDESERFIPADRAPYPTLSRKEKREYIRQRRKPCDIAGFAARHSRHRVVMDDSRNHTPLTRRFSRSRDEKHWTIGQIPPRNKDEKECDGETRNPTAELGLTIQSLPHIIWSRLLTMISRSMWPATAPGMVRVSWACRCGRPLYIDVPRSSLQAAVNFASEATSVAGSVQVSPGSSTSNSSDQSNVSSPVQGVGSLTSEGSAGNDSQPVANLQSPDPIQPALPPSLKRYFLVCVNTGPHQIRLAQIDVTHIHNDQSLYGLVWESYKGMRGSLFNNRLMVPTTVSYVKFELVHKHSTGEHVGNYEKDSIPTIKEVMGQEYTFSPCPPRVGLLPIQQHIFMHSLLNPGDHTGSLAIQRLPKKLKERLSVTAGSTTSPLGWGVYIIEGPDMFLVSMLLAITMFFVLSLVSIWSVLKDDVQGGTGIGQFALAFLALGSA